MKDEESWKPYFTDLEPYCQEARALYPFPFKVLESPAASSSVRRQAFRGLVRFVVDQWTSAVPGASGLPRRRQSTLAFLAIVDSSPLASLHDGDLMSLYHSMIARPIRQGPAPGQRLDDESRYSALHAAGTR